jgi:hypothetical protein
LPVVFKSNHRIFNFEPHWSAVSYLVSSVIDIAQVSGVIDSAHHWSAVSIPVVSDAIDTADHKKSDLKVEHLGKFESTLYRKRPLPVYQGPRMSCLMKKPLVGNLVTGFLKIFYAIL